MIFTPQQHWFHFTANKPLLLPYRHVTGATTEITSRAPPLWIKLHLSAVPAQGAHGLLAQLTR